MIEEYYKNIQFIVWVLLLVTGCFLLLGKVPAEAAFKTYRRSRKIMGVAFFIYWLQFFLQWKLNVRDEFPMVASALNITVFYLASVMVGLSFISLLDEKYLNRKRVITDLSVCLAVDFAVWGAIAFLPTAISVWILILAALWLFVYVVRISWIFFCIYRSSVKKIQNYYSDNVDCFIRWMSRSVFFAIAMGLLCSTMAFAPKWMITFYLAACIPFFYYIFSSFINYLIHFETVANAVAEEPIGIVAHESIAANDIFPNDEADKPHTPEDLEENLQAWIAEKGYREPKINMTELARLVKTNRSYLSVYINSKYSCTFYKWIATLRIEDAKILLRDEPELTVVQIAENVGFSSSSHFIRLFTEKMGRSPIKWRNENLSGKNNRDHSTRDNRH